MFKIPRQALKLLQAFTIGRRIRCVGLGTLLAATLPATAADQNQQAAPTPKRVVIPKLSEQIKIDGELAEPAWKSAAVLTPFLLNQGSATEQEKTELRLWYDASALYLGWTCHDVDIQATFTARDSKFWEEEVVEFFVTAKDLKQYFELQWNPLGGVFDAIIHNQLGNDGLSQKIDGDWSFTANGMQSAVKLKGTPGNSNDRDELWQVEVRIPFSDLGQPAPRSGDVWRGNFYRFNRTKGQPVEQLAWSPTGRPSFHEPSRFGYLEFGKDGPNSP